MEATVLSVSANNLQTSLFMHLLAYNSTLAHYSMGISQCQTSLTTMKATGTQGSCLSGIVQG